MSNLNSVALKREHSSSDLPLRGNSIGIYLFKFLILLKIDMKAYMVVYPIPNHIFYA